MYAKDYDTLQISSAASVAEIKKAYRKLTILYHPDRNDAPDAAAKFIAITEAYDRLMEYHQTGTYTAPQETTQEYYTREEREYNGEYTDPITEDLSNEADAADEDDVFMRLSKAGMQLFLLGIAYFFLMVLIHIGNLFSIVFMLTVFILLLLPLNLLNVIYIESDSIKALALLKSFLKSPLGITVVFNFFMLYAYCEIGLLTFCNHFNLILSTILGISIVYYAVNRWIPNNKSFWAPLLGFCLPTLLLNGFLMLNYFIDSPTEIIISTTNQQIQVNRNMPFYEGENEYVKIIPSVYTKGTKQLWGLDLYNSEKLYFDSIVYTYHTGYLGTPCVKMFAFGLGDE